MSNLLSLCSFDYSEMREKAGGGGACLPWVFLGADAGLKFVTVAGHVLGQLVDDRLYVWGWGDDQSENDVEKTEPSRENQPTED